MRFLQIMVCFSCLGQKRLNGPVMSRFNFYLYGESVSAKCQAPARTLLHIFTFSSSAVNELAPILLSAMTTPRHSLSAITGNVSMHLVLYPVCLSTKSQNFLFCFKRGREGEHVTRDLSPPKNPELKKTNTLTPKQASVASLKGLCQHDFFGCFWAKSIINCWLHLM